MVHTTPPSFTNNAGKQNRGLAVAMLSILIGLACVACSASKVARDQPFQPRAPDIRLAIQPTAAAPKDKAVHRSHLDGIVLSIQNDAPAPYSLHVVLKLASDAQVSLFFRLPKDIGLPFQSGERLRIESAQQWDEKANVYRRAMLVRDGKREIRLIFQVNRLLPNESLPRRLKVKRGTTVVYTESARIKDLCVAITEHRTLRVDAQDSRADLKPGHNLQMTLEEGSFVFWAIDNRQTQHTTCENYGDDVMSWLAVRVSES